MLSQAFQIMSKGEFQQDVLEKYVFKVPYPYTEYLRYEKLGSLSTPEALDLFMESGTKHVDEQKEKFWFVELRRSDEANFVQAYEHMKSYKHIKQQFQIAFDSQIERHNFHESNKKEVEIIENGDPMYDEKNTDPIYQKHHDIWQKNRISLETLQTSFKILAQRLEDGEMIKGKCNLGY